MSHWVLWGDVLKYGYSCQLECAQTNGKLVSCGIYPQKNLKLVQDRREMGLWLWSQVIINELTVP